MRRKGFKYEKNKAIPCPKCNYDTSVTKDLSMSTRSHKFGRQQQGVGSDDEEGYGGYYSYGASSSAGYTYDDDESEGDESDSDDEDEDEESTESEAEVEADDDGNKEKK